MNLEKNERLTQLFEFYGILLTKTQQQYFNDYYFDDFSLAEIAENAKVSRQAVFDNLKRTGRILEEYEIKLQLLQNFEKLDQYIVNSLEQIENGQTDSVKANLLKMKQLIEEN